MSSDKRAVLCGVVHCLPGTRYFRSISTGGGRKDKAMNSAGSYVTIPHHINGSTPSDHRVNSYSSASKGKMQGLHAGNTRLE